MKIESDKQVGWLLKDYSERGEKMEMVAQLLFGAAAGMLVNREDVTISRQWDSHLEDVIRSPEREFCEWRLLMASRIPSSGMARLRQDFAEVHASLFQGQFQALNLPSDLIEERRSRGLLVVPGHIALGPDELWVPAEYSFDGSQRARID